MPETIVPRCAIRTKQEVSAQASADFYELTRRFGLAQLQANIGSKDPTSITKLHNGTGFLPEAHTLLNALVTCPEALAATLLLYGVVAVPVKGGPVDDMKTVGQMLHAAAEYFDRMQDKVRCPSDTAALAKLFRPLLPAMVSIIREAGGQDEPKLKAVA